MIQRYRFTRLSDKLIEETDCQDVIADCFIPCEQSVKNDLAKFFLDRKQKSIKFEFPDRTVIVEKVVK